MNKCPACSHDECSKFSCLEAVARDDIPTARSVDQTKMPEAIYDQEGEGNDDSIDFSAQPVVVEGLISGAIPNAHQDSSSKDINHGSFSSKVTFSEERLVVESDLAREDRPDDHVLWWSKDDVFNAFQAKKQGNLQQQQPPNAKTNGNGKKVTKKRKTDKRNSKNTGLAVRTLAEELKNLLVDNCSNKSSSKALRATSKQKEKAKQDRVRFSDSSSFIVRESVWMLEDLQRFGVWYSKEDIHRFQFEARETARTLQPVHTEFVKTLQNFLNFSGHEPCFRKILESATAQELFWLSPSSTRGLEVHLDETIQKQRTNHVKRLLKVQRLVKAGHTNKTMEHALYVSARHTSRPARALAQLLGKKDRYQVAIKYASGVPSLRRHLASVATTLATTVAIATQS